MCGDMVLIIIFISFIIFEFYEWNDQFFYIERKNEKKEDRKLIREIGFRQFENREDEVRLGVQVREV